MLEFFREGGFSMYPVLVFGLLMVAAAGRYAFDPEPARLRTMNALGWLLAVTVVHALVTNFGAVMAHVSNPEICPDEDVMRHLFTGLMESTRPAALGGALLSLGLVLGVVGTARAGQREVRAKAA